MSDAGSSIHDIDDDHMGFGIIGLDNSNSACPNCHVY